MVVLVKTASVWVSFIQIMQVRVQNKGKRVWKSRYVGDVSSHSVLLLVAMVDASGRFFFLLGDSASKDEEAVLFFPPPWGTRLLPPPHHLRSENGHWSLWVLCPKLRGERGCPWSPWPPSQPSSSVPCKALGPASSSEVGQPVLLAVGPDSVSAPPSSSIPGRILESTLKRLPRDMPMKHMNCQT